jgi:uncharacterized Zn finger protein
MDHVHVGEYQLRGFANKKSFERGEQYFNAGRVLSVARSGDRIVAEVSGSTPRPYRVEMDWRGSNLFSAMCTCPYGYGDLCKHIIAAALTVIRRPGLVEQRQSLNELLPHLSRSQLQSIILHLAESQPGLEDYILTLVQATGPDERTNSTTDEEPGPEPGIDQNLIRRRVRAALQSLDGMRPSEAYWHVGEVVARVEAVVAEAHQLTEFGRGRDAIAVLDAATSEYLSGWTGLDDSNGEASEFLWILGNAWAETILAVDFTAEEREDLVQKIDEFASDLFEYGLDEAFFSAADAAKLGWDDPVVQAAMAGEAIGDADLQHDPLLGIRLDILERQERFEEFMNLASAGQATGRYLSMLLHLDRIDEAYEEALKLIATADGALQFAALLQERGATERALDVGRHGLQLPGTKHLLAPWVRDSAAARGDLELALQAGLIAVEEAASLEGYLRVRDYAGEEWPEFRERLLGCIRATQHGYPFGAVEIFLHEGMIPEAIAIADHAWYDRLVEMVADAAVESHPDWVIRQSVYRADEIMNAGRAAEYDGAARWMARAKQAYESAGRDAEWDDVLRERLERHQRKYKLRPLLERLGN